MTLNTHLATAAAYATFIERLLDSQMSVFDFIRDTGLSDNTVRKLLKILKRRNRIHVCRWAPASDGRFVIAVYALGNLPDAPKPPRKTPTERSAKRRNKLKKETYVMAMSNTKAVEVLSKFYGIPVDPVQAYREVRNLALNPSGPATASLEEEYGVTIQALARYAELNWPSSTH